MFSRLVLIFLFASNQPKFGIAQELAPPGQWKEYLPYGSAIKVAVGSNVIFCATPYSVFSYNPTDNEFTRYSKITGLAETGISTIGFDNITKNLLIAYSNSNLDIVSANNIANIPDIKRKNYTGDKNIYNIYFLNSMAYLSTGLGIVVIDELRNETKDTYVPGSTGNFIKITGITSDPSYLYAATTEGLKRAALNSDLTDFHNWQILSSGIVQDVVNFQDHIIFAKNDSLFSLTGNATSFLYADGWQLTNINLSSGKLLISENKPSLNGRVVSLFSNGTIETSLQFPGSLKIPQEAIFKDNQYYTADLFGGLEKLSNNSLEKIFPNSPFERSSGEMIIFKNKLFIAAGEVNSAWNYTYNPFGLFKFENDYWSFYNQYNNHILDSVNDIITVTVDRRNEDVYYGSFGGGLVRLSNNNLKIYKQSALEAALGDPGSYRVSGLCYDAANNLWISNYGAANELLVKKADSTWKTFTPPFTLFDNAVSQILVDDQDQKWIVSPKGNGLLCLNTGSSIDNTSDDRWKLFRTGTGNGNLPDNQVFCIAKDKNGLIWVGTATGIALIPCPGEIFTSGCEAILPVVQQGAFAGNLFQNEEVRTIAVDGANRKWVGTTNGLWLISSDGETVINHFTEDNSPLLNNDIHYLTIHPQTGEVFIETFKGLCSYRGTSTEGTDKNENVLIFPNPVPPGFSGLIGIRGLVNNAIVKITELDGRLVYETRALGGQAVWNGKNYKDQKVSSGAYLVLATDETNKEKVVSKIFIVR